MNSESYQQILKENVRRYVCVQTLKRMWVMQKDNDTKQTSGSPEEWLKKNKVNVLEWPSQSPDLNPREMLWKDLKWAVHVRKPTHIRVLKLFRTKEWAKMYPSQCAGLIEAYMAKFQEQDHTSTAPTSDIPINNHLTLSSSSLSSPEKSASESILQPPSAVSPPASIAWPELTRVRTSSITPPLTRPSPLSNSPWKGCGSLQHPLVWYILLRR